MVSLIPFPRLIAPRLLKPGAVIKMSAKTEILSILAEHIVSKASLHSTCGSLNFSS